MPSERGRCTVAIAVPIDFDPSALANAEALSEQWRATRELHGDCLRLCYALIANAASKGGRYWNVVSQVCDSNGHWEAAETSAVTATIESPALAFSHYRVGWVRVQRNNPVAAIAPLERACQLQASGRYQSMLAYALAEADEQHERIRALCEQAIAASITDMWTLQSVALCWLLLGDAAAAERWSMEVLSKTPSSYSHLYVLAGAQRLQGRLLDALATADRAIAVYADGSGAHAERSEALRLLRHWDEAVEAGRTAAKIAPISWEAQWALVQALSAAGHHEEAERVALECAAASAHPRMKAIPANLAAMRAASTETSRA